VTVLERRGEAIGMEAVVAGNHHRDYQTDGQAEAIPVFGRDPAVLQAAGRRDPDPALQAHPSGPFDAKMNHAPNGL
jgi:hypothetical protein